MDLTAPYVRDVHFAILLRRFTMGSGAEKKFEFREFMQATEKTMTAQFEQSRSIAHLGDRGENREGYLREFLEKHLPSRYGFAKGQIVTKDGKVSHAVDIIIYDRLTCPVFYSGNTSIIPIEGVYGIIEVKSSLSKTELEDAAEKIKKFKELAPRDLGILDIGTAVTVRRASRPFGIVFGYQLSGNSLNSLRDNITEFHRKVFYTDYFVNLVCVIGVGNIFLEGIRWDQGEKTHLIETDSAVRFFENIDFDQRAGIDVDKKYGARIVAEEGPDSIGRFLSYLQVILSRMVLNVPDLGTYVGVGMPPLILKQ